MCQLVRTGSVVHFVCPQTVPWDVRVGQASLYSQVLLQPLWWPCNAGARRCFTVTPMTVKLEGCSPPHLMREMRP